MMDFFNPNDYWRNQGYDPYKGMSDDEKSSIAVAGAIGIIVGILVGFAICALI